MGPAWRTQLHGPLRPALATPPACLLTPRPEVPILR